MKVTKYSDIIQRNFGSDYIDEGSEVRYQCPNCNKLGKKYDDYKLYVNINSAKFNCFRCGWKGKLYSSDISSTSNSDKLLDKLKSMLPINFNESEDDCDTVYYRLPSIKPKPDDPAVKYLVDRGISYQDIVYYNMRVTSPDDLDLNLSGRITIPNKVIAGKWTDMYSSRAYLDLTPKYKNPKNSPKNSTVFNLHNIPDNPEQIIIVEGVLTAISAGRDAVCTYGKSVSKSQMTQILSKKPKRLYLCMDNDADLSGIDKTQYKVDEIISNLLKLKDKDTELYWIVMPPNKDALDVGREYFREKLLRNSIKINNLSEYNIISKLVNRLY